MRSFRVLSLIEGISLLLLLFVAMPLKYYLAVGGPVFYIGMAHGVLFLCYLVASLAISHKQGWSIAYWLLVFGLGLVPLGFLLLDKKLKQEDQPAEIAEV